MCLQDLYGAAKEVLAAKDVEIAVLSEKVEPMWSQTMTHPVTSASRRHLLMSAEPLSGQQKCLYAMLCALVHQHGMVQSRNCSAFK